MKTKLFISFLFICFAITALYINHLSFSPLKERDFQKLFGKHKGNIEKVCEVDYLGLSFHGELFEIYLYKVDTIFLDLNYPNYSESWEEKEFSDKILTSKWAKCPPDSITQRMFEFTLTANNFSQEKYFDYFYIDLNNLKNYYSYFYVNELENYFILYCLEKRTFYYVRRKGL
ncbi:hypothetical protein [Hugenholtzia roseola]|uniref:hypothetical protein n=1 Tax=Hugenholtzia roseola TaxID=1002 RepID=UPI000401D794|nr:hypothetical protein [Hugenholtzia roseola]